MIKICAQYACVMFVLGMWGGGDDEELKKDQEIAEAGKAAAEAALQIQAEAAKGLQVEKQQLEDKVKEQAAALRSGQKSLRGLNFQASRLENRGLNFQTSYKLRMAQAYTGTSTIVSMKLMNSGILDYQCLEA